MALLLSNWWTSLPYIPKRIKTQYLPGLKPVIICGDVIGPKGRFKLSAFSVHRLRQEYLNWYVWGANEGGIHIIVIVVLVVVNVRVTVGLPVE